MMEALSSSKTSVLIGATRRNIPEDGIIHSHRSKNLRSYMNKFDSGYGIVVGFCESGNEFSDALKCWKYLGPMTIL
jgi:hypothetical protein